MHPELMVFTALYVADTNGAEILTFASFFMELMHSDAPTFISNLEFLLSFFLYIIIRYLKIDQLALFFNRTLFNLRVISIFSL